MTPALPRLLLVGFSAVAASLWVPSPAAADSFSFGYSSGHRHRQHHHHQRRHHHGPRYHYGYSYYAPPPVYYAPPPRVVYVPAPPALSAVPASPVYRTSDGQYCREYQSTVSVGGQPQPSYGTACLQPDGSWRVVN